MSEPKEEPADDLGSFRQFIDQQKSSGFRTDSESRYAYSADVEMLRGFKKIKPVERAAEALVRSSREWMNGDLLGRMVRVSATQLPHIDKIAAHCAATLQVKRPEVFLVNHPMLNAYTFGSEDNAFIVLHSSLVDSFNESELTFVVGHEMGHIHNHHVVYGTTLSILTRTASAVVGLIAQPAILALQAWYRRAEITCDRAGLLCNQDLDGAVTSFLKLAVGSPQLVAQMNLDEYLSQLTETRSSVGRIKEAFETHPYLPKRIEALKLFAQSGLYRESARWIGNRSSSTGQTPADHLEAFKGLSLDEVDRRVSELLRIFGSTSDRR